MLELTAAKVELRRTMRQFVGGARRLKEVIRTRIYSLIEDLELEDFPKGIYFMFKLEKLAMI